jgi:hypothetical protein
MAWIPAGRLPAFRHASRPALLLLSAALMLAGGQGARPAPAPDSAPAFGRREPPTIGAREATEVLRRLHALTGPMKSSRDSARARIAWVSAAYGANPREAVRYLKEVATSSEPRVLVYCMQTWGELRDWGALERTAARIAASGTASEIQKAQARAAVLTGRVRSGRADSAQVAASLSSRPAELAQLFLFSRDAEPGRALVDRAAALGAAERLSLARTLPVRTALEFCNRLPGEEASDLHACAVAARRLGAAGDAASASSLRMKARGWPVWRRATAAARYRIDPEAVDLAADLRAVWNHHATLRRQLARQGATAADRVRALQSDYAAFKGTLEEALAAAAELERPSDLRAISRVALERARGNRGNAGWFLLAKCIGALAGAGDGVTAAELCVANMGEARVMFAARATSEALGRNGDTEGWKTFYARVREGRSEAARLRYPHDHEAEACLSAFRNGLVERGLYAEARSLVEADGDPRYEVDLAGRIARVSIRRGDARRAISELDRLIRLSASGNKSTREFGTRIGSRTWPEITYELYSKSLPGAVHAILDEFDQPSQTPAR